MFFEMFTEDFWSIKKVENPKKFQREFQSFVKKLSGNKHEVWFLSLDTKKQWDLLFEWKSYKYHVKKSNQKSVSFKKFIHSMRLRRKFRVSKQRLRESALNKIIDI